MPPDDEHRDSTLALRIHRIHRAAELKEMADRNLRWTQGQYKRDHDRKAQCEPIFATSDYIFVECPPLRITASGRPAAESYSELCLRRLPPFRIISVRHEVVHIIQDALKTPLAGTSVSSSGDEYTNNSPQHCRNENTQSHVGEMR